MWLAQFVCAPQFFKTPKGLCEHTVCTIACFFPHGQLYVAFSLRSSFDSVAVQLLKGIGSVQNMTTDNIKHCTSKSALKFQVYKDGERCLGDGKSNKNSPDAGSSDISSDLKDRANDARDGS
jgi:hypothetical protein